MQHLTRHLTIKRASALLLAVAFILGSCATLATVANIPTADAATLAPTAATASPAPLLPGETLWSGVPSYLFGAGDTWDYIGAPGFDENTTIQQQVKAARVPLIRAFFETHSETDGSLVSDAHQLQIAQAIQNSGAQCMANITQPVTVAQALHLVSILKPYCRSFEVYNEPDLDGTTVASYLTFWDSFVPQARAIDPGALFGGPTLSCEYGMDTGCPSTPTGSSYMELVLQGMKSANVIPDFVSYHFYICAGDGQSACLADAANYTPGHGKSLTAYIQKTFGKAIPQGITEWSADPGNPPWAYDDAFMAQFEQAALSGFEQNPYLSFLTQFDIASYAGYGTLDMFRTSNPEATDGSTTLDYTETPPVIGAARPMFGVLASQIASLSSGSPPSPSTPTPTPTSTPPAPTPTTAPTATPPPSPVPGGVPRYAHVINVLMENHSYSDVIGSSSAPYINGTLIKSGALATNFSAEVASSLPNYMALTGGTTLGWTGNCEPQPTPPNGVGPCPGGLSTGPSMFSEAPSWRAYDENMTANCQNAVDGGAGGLYTVHHNPAAFYSGLATACAQNDVPYSQLASDLASPSSLPAYVFITPNLNDDMHNGTVSQGDTWLSTAIPAIQQSPACQQSSCLIAVTWDEGSSDEHIATILLGPGVQPGARDATAYNHYNLLRTEELALGLPTMTTHDAAASPMLGMFSQGGSPTPTPTPAPSPTATPTNTPTPSPTPSPTPAPPATFPCVVLVNGVMTLGTCTGTFTPNP